MDRYNRYLDHSGLEYKQYQSDGVRWCINNELRIDPPYQVRGGLIADEMGLGKTIIMIGLMYSNVVNHTLVVVPPILIDQWFHQIHKTTGHKPLIYHGSNKKTITIAQLNDARIVITTYGAITLSKKQLKENVVTNLHKINWDRVVFDEAHHLRNRNTNSYLSASALSAKIRWLVSGTPIQNSKKDFYSLCSLLRLPASFYLDKTQIVSLLREFVLKRSKLQVGIQISDIQQTKTDVNWSSQKEMRLSEDLHSALSFSRVNPGKSINNAFVSTLLEKGTISVLLRAKQSCIYPALMSKTLDSISNIISDKEYTSYKEAFKNSSKLTSVVQAILERKYNECGKLVFCHFREEIDEIAARLRNGGMDKVVTLDGRTSKGSRHDILTEKNNVLIIQIQTGCEGLNLQENYSEIYFISPHWNPSVEDQAIARCHRIGQTKTVYVFRFEMNSFVSEDELPTRTIDKYIGDVQESKRIIVSEIITNPL
jgi:SNF2 family DNA or RNA helicase